ncbi:MAG: DMT family transporter [Coriobacteriales bacterium]|jgi:quaternary ammonium compound-resistance protein SugE
MNWVVLFASGVLESIWAIALGKSEGFSHPVPTIVFIVALIASMLGLAYAVRTLPIGMSYAIWVGIGAAITIVYGMATGGEPISVVRVLLLAGLLGCIVGLRLTTQS